MLENLGRAVGPDPALSKDRPQQLLPLAVQAENRIAPLAEARSRVGDPAELGVPVPAGGQRDRLDQPTPAKARPPQQPPHDLRRDRQTPVRQPADDLRGRQVRPAEPSPDGAACGAALHDGPQAGRPAGRTARRQDGPQAGRPAGRTARRQDGPQAGRPAGRPSTADGTVPVWAAAPSPPHPARRTRPAAPGPPHPARRRIAVGSPSDRRRIAAFEVRRLPDPAADRPRRAARDLRDAGDPAAGPAGGRRRGRPPPVLLGERVVEVLEVSGVCGGQPGLLRRSDDGLPVRDVPLAILQADALRPAQTVIHPASLGRGTGGEGRAARTSSECSSRWHPLPHPRPLSPQGAGSLSSQELE